MSDKKTKSQVDYRPKDAHNCGTCAYMLNDGHCRKVQGIVDRQHVCDLWRKG